MKKAYWFIFLVMMAGCAPQYNPFQIPKEEMLAKVKTIGIMPLRYQVEVNDPNGKRLEFENKISDKLKECGFASIASGEYMSIYKQLKDAAGQMYDPCTGQPDKEKFEVLNKNVMQEYLAKYKPDALLYPRIVIVKAGWSYNRAEWNGATEPSTGKEGLWASMTAPSATGTLPALSLAVDITGIKNEPYFLNYGGIQLYSWVGGYRQFTDVPKELLLANHQRNSRSVDIALAPLVPKPQK